MKSVTIRKWIEKDNKFETHRYLYSGNISTNIKDKFGKEIFEGDKVICKSSMRPEGVKMTVQWEPCGRWNICNEGVKWLNDLGVEYEIIGNVYEQ